MTSMNCAAARELMLSADPGELRLAVDSPLAAHIRDCAACQRSARSLVAQIDALDSALQALVTERSAAPARSRVTARRWAAAAPLAAAAMLLLMLLGRSALQSSADLEPIVLPVRAVPATAVVNAAQTGAVAIMQTSNPNITVVWHMESMQ